MNDEQIKDLIELLSEGQRQLYWNHGDEELDLGVMGRYPKMNSVDWMNAVDDFLIEWNKTNAK